MITRYHGNRIIFIVEGTDTVQTIPITLPDGYSVRKMLITTNSDLSLYDGTNNPATLPPNVLLDFPIVNCKSPNKFYLRIVKVTHGSSLIINIFQFGGIPDSHYFDEAFKPILVTTNDENNHAVEYNMIPSTQFER